MAILRTDRPDPSEYPGFNPRYVDLVPEGDVLSIMAPQAADLRRLMGTVAAERESFAYQPGKWTIRQVINHLGDTERVLGYRALCIARGEASNLPGFNEDGYEAAAGALSRSVMELVEGFELARNANLHFLRALSADAWVKRGTANGHPVSVRALAYVMAGHVPHHVALLAERYGVQGQ